MVLSALPAGTTKVAPAGVVRGIGAALREATFIKFSVAPPKLPVVSVMPVIRKMYPDNSVLNTPKDCHTAALDDGKIGLPVELSTWLEKLAVVMLSVVVGLFSLKNKRSLPAGPADGLARKAATSPPAYGPPMVVALVEVAPSGTVNSVELAAPLPDTV